MKSVMPIIRFCFLVLLIFLSSLLSAQTSVDMQRTKADSLYEQKDYEAAVVLFEELYANTTAPSKNKGDYSYFAGKCHQRLGDIENAEISYQKAGAIFSDLKLWDDFYKVQSSLAVVSENVGRYDDAIRIGLQTFAYYTAKKDTLTMLKELNNLAISYYYSGYLKQAIGLYTQAIDLASIVGDDYTQATCYNELGNIWAIDLQNEEKALEYYRKGLQLKIKAEVPLKSISFSCNNIGISHKNLGRSDSAMFYYQLALNYAIQSNEPAAKTNPLINIANLQKSQGDRDGAIETFQKLLEMIDVISIRQQINVYTNLGILYNEENNYSEALVWLDKARDLVNETNDLIDKADIQGQKAIAHEGLQEYEKAFGAQKNLAALKDSLYQREREDELADLLVRYEAVEKDKFIAEQDLVITKNEREIEKRNLWLISVSLLAVLVIIIYWLVMRRKKMQARAKEEQKVNRAIFESEQKERVRIARDLHDSIGQKLSVMKMLVSKSDKTSADFLKISNYLDEAAIEVRSISHNLVPEILNFGLAKAFDDLVEQVNEGGSIHVELQLDETLKALPLPLQTEVSIFRIVQEIIANIIRHSGTDTIFIKVFTEQNALQILIIDRGKGFDTKAIDKADGLGWKNIFARIKLVDGQIKVKSRPGSGSEFYIHIPLI